MWISALELLPVPKHLRNFLKVPHANKAPSQAAYLFLQWEMDGETGQQSAY